MGYFNDIDCASETHCIAVAEGYVADGGAGGCHVFMTTNGMNWTEVYTYGNQTNGGCLSAKMLSETEIWVGTTYAETQFKSGAEFSHSVDGGKTWTTEKVLKEIGVVTQMSFIDDHHGYAVGVTTL